MLIVLTTTPNIGEAESLAEQIVAAKLAACVQILPQMKSVYVWEGKVGKQSENLLLIKTLEEKYDNLAAFITANHSYEVPEIIAINAEKVSEPFSAWLSEAIRN